MPYGTLVVVKRNGKDGAKFPLVTTRCLIGRDLNCDIRIQLIAVSAKHCRIDVRSDNQVFLTNLSDVNPTQLNENAINGSARLYDNDTFTVADRLFRWEVYPKEDVSPPKLPSLGSEKSVPQVDHQTPVIGDASEETAIERRTSLNVVENKRRSSNRNKSPSSPIYEKQLASPKSPNFRKPQLPKRLSSARKSTPALKIGVGSGSSPFGRKSFTGFGSNAVVEKQQSVTSSDKPSDDQVKVSFGPNLSPEHFDESLPVSTPLRKGERPRNRHSLAPDYYGSPIISPVLTVTRLKRSFSKYKYTIPEETTPPVTPGRANRSSFSRKSVSVRKSSTVTTEAFRSKSLSPKGNYARIKPPTSSRRSLSTPKRRKTFHPLSKPKKKIAKNDDDAVVKIDAPSSPDSKKLAALRTIHASKFKHINHSPSDVPLKLVKGSEKKARSIPSTKRKQSLNSTATNLLSMSFYGSPKLKNAPSASAIKSSLGNRRSTKKSISAVNTKSSPVKSPISFRFKKKCGPELYAGVSSSEPRKSLRNRSVVIGTLSRRNRTTGNLTNEADGNVSEISKPANSIVARNSSVKMNRRLLKSSGDINLLASDKSKTKVSPLNGSQSASDRNLSIDSLDYKTPDLTKDVFISPLSTISKRTPAYTLQRLIDGDSGLAKRFSLRSSSANANAADYDMMNASGTESFTSPASTTESSMKVKTSRAKRVKSSPDIDYESDNTQVRGVKELIRYPVRKKPSPVPDYTDVRGVKRLLRTPNAPKPSPEPDYTDVSGIKRLLRSTPKADYVTNVDGVKRLLKPGTPKADYSDVKGLKRLMAAAKSPNSDYSDVRGLKRLMRSPRVQIGSPVADYSNVEGVENLMKTPAKSLLNDSSSKLELTEKLNTRQTRHSNSTQTPEVLIKSEKKSLRLSSGTSTKTPESNTRPNRPSLTVNSVKNTPPIVHKRRSSVHSPRSMRNSSVGVTGAMRLSSDISSTETPKSNARTNRLSPIVNSIKKTPLIARRSSVHSPKSIQNASVASTQMSANLVSDEKATPALRKRKSEPEVSGKSASVPIETISPEQKSSKKDKSPTLVSSTPKKRLKSNRESVERTDSVSSTRVLRSSRRTVVTAKLESGRKAKLAIARKSPQSKQKTPVDILEIVADDRASKSHSGTAVKISEKIETIKSAEVTATPVRKGKRSKKVALKNRYLSPKLDAVNPSMSTEKEMSPNDTKKATARKGRNLRSKKDAHANAETSLAIKISERVSDNGMNRDTVVKKGRMLKTGTIVSIIATSPVAVAIVPARTTRTSRKRLSASPIAASPDSRPKTRRTARNAKTETTAVVSDNKVDKVTRKKTANQQPPTNDELNNSASPKRRRTNRNRNEVATVPEVQQSVGRNTRGHKVELSNSIPEMSTPAARKRKSTIKKSQLSPKSEEQKETMTSKQSRSAKKNKEMTNCASPANKISSKSVKLSPAINRTTRSGRTGMKKSMAKTISSKGSKTKVSPLGTAAKAQSPVRRTRSRKK